MIYDEIHDLPNSKDKKDCWLSRKYEEEWYDHFSKTIKVTPGYDLYHYTHTNGCYLIERL